MYLFFTVNALACADMNGFKVLAYQCMHPFGRSLQLVRDLHAQGFVSKLLPALDLLFGALGVALLAKTSMIGIGKLEVDDHDHAAAAAAAAVGEMRWDSNTYFEVVVGDSSGMLVCYWCGGRGMNRTSFWEKVLRSEGRGC